MIKSFQRTLLFALMLFSQSIASANTAEFNNAATRITDLLLAQGKTTVAFESFKRGADAQGNFGPGLRSELMIAFESVNKQRKTNHKKFVTIGENAIFTVRGSYSVGDDPNDPGRAPEDRLLAVEVNIEITDGTEKQSDFTFYLTRERDVIVAEGLSFRVDKDNDTRTTHKKIRKAIAAVKSPNRNAKPMFVVDGTKIKTARNSEYAVELLTRSPAGKKYTARPPRRDSGALPLVPIGVGEVYGVKIYNKSKQEIGVSMKIDGIDQFTFSEDRDPNTARPRFNAWIIGPESSFIIKGWHISSDNSRDDNLSGFQVKKYGEGASKYADAVDRSANGVITVAIARSFDPKNAKSTATETGLGPPIKQQQTVVNRRLDPPHEFLSIRYNR